MHIIPHQAKHNKTFKEDALPYCERERHFIMKTVSVKDITLRKSTMDVLDELGKTLETTCDAASALYDCNGEGLFDVPGAGEVLLTCESMIFTLRAIMFTVVNNDLGDDLMSGVIAMVSDVVELRDLVADDLDEILGDTDSIIEESLSDLDDAFTIWVPIDAAVEIDGEPIDLVDYLDEEEDGEVPIDILPGELLAVDGCHVDLSECEPGEAYDLLDLDDEEGSELPDDPFVLWVPGSSVILWDGKPWTPKEESLDDEIGLVVGTDTELNIDGCDIDLTECEPGEEYRFEDGIVVPADSFVLRVPFDAEIVIGKTVLEKDDEFNEDGFVSLILTADVELTVDGIAVDLSGCEPGGEYDASIEDAG